MLISDDVALNGDIGKRLEIHYPDQGFIILLRLEYSTITQ